MYLTREGQGHITNLERLRSEQEGQFLLQSQGQPDFEYVLTQKSLGKTVYFRIKFSSSLYIIWK